MNTTEAQASTPAELAAVAAKLTPPQIDLLHDLAADRRYGRENVIRALVRKGLVSELRAPHGLGTYPALTDLGRQVHASIWTPERLAAEAAALRATRLAGQRRVAEARAAVQAEADARNAASARLADMLGETAVPSAFSTLVSADLGAKPHGDFSGVNLGKTYGGVTSADLLAFAEAVLAAAQR